MNECHKCVDAILCDEAGMSWFGVLGASKEMPYGQRLAQTCEGHQDEKKLEYLHVEQGERVFESFELIIAAEGKRCREYWYTAMKPLSRGKKGKGCGKVQRARKFILPRRGGWIYTVGCMACEYQVASHLLFLVWNI
jgi:hypothetical protein